MRPKHILFHYKEDDPHVLQNVQIDFEDSQKQHVGNIAFTLSKSLAETTVLELIEVGLDGFAEINKNLVREILK